MKPRLYSLLFAIGIFTTALAQSLNVKQGQVVWRYDAQKLLQQPLEFRPIDGSGNTDGRSTLAIGNSVFNTADISELTIDNNAFQPSVVTIDVAALTTGGTVVVADGTLSPHLSVRCTPSAVFVTASPELATEVTYRLTGTASAGVVLSGRYKCAVRLENLRLTSPDTLPALHINNGKRIDIILPDGTDNYLADAATNKRKSAFFVKGHADFKGGGTLNIVGNARHAYSSNEYTRIRAGFGTLNVTAAIADALHIDQYFRMDGGTLNLSGVGGDGIDIARTLNPDGTVNTADEYNGEFFLNDGVLNIQLRSDDVKGIKAESHATIAGGTLKATVEGLGVKGLSCDGNLIISQKTTVPTLVNILAKGDVYHPKQIDESKTRGIKADGSFTLDGGTVSVSSSGTKAKDIKVGTTYTYVSGTLSGNVDVP